MLINERVFVLGTKIGIVLLKNPSIALILSIEDMHVMVEALLDAIEKAQANRKSQCLEADPWMQK